MIIREAQLKDIPEIQIVRNSVKENMLSNPNLVTDKDCEEFLFQRGKGWVCEIDNQIVGFSIVDLKENNIWALFLHPDFEKQGIGRKLHDIMLNWYFDQTQENVWLGNFTQYKSRKLLQKIWLERNRNAWKRGNKI
ncbi:GNAT superfamily N-acetyltransferase [Chryseobacterium ginsenosidimutans]|uniref:GNAT family N-acetyltransferase n=1 Tax=Chryseobacterium ginsenosidimutans TaxID=687846 RepID=UPI00216A6A5D|nr:GNAT family N-acetyltransferase [Chryseobacterium ginsenosidimutans]MCS3869741.1 GNAT superfamily N-acetyltransferase [Chryseobacterium ginsenosidimutans]